MLLGHIIRIYFKFKGVKIKLKLNLSLIYIYFYINVEHKKSKKILQREIVLTCLVLFQNFKFKSGNLFRPDYLFTNRKHVVLLLNSNILS